MTRTKYTVALAAALAVGLLAVKLAVSADGPGPKAPAAGEAWDDGGPMPGHLDGQLAQRGPDGIGPGGPPRDGDDDRPPPPRGKGRGPQADRGQPPGPPDGDDDEGPMGPPSDRRGPPGGDRQPMGPPNGGQGRQPMPPGMPPGGMPGGPGGMGPGGMPGGPGAMPGGRMPGGPGMPGGRGGMSGGMSGGMFGPMQQNDPEMFALLKQDMELERQTRELAMQYRQASKDDREKLKSQIAEVVGKHFDVRQQRRALELKRLEQQLKDLRESMDRRSKARKDIVERRVAELTGQPDEMGF